LSLTHKRVFCERFVGTYGYILYQNQQVFAVNENQMLLTLTQICQDILSYFTWLCFS